MNARDLRPLSPVSSDPSERGERSDAICAPFGKFRLVAKLGRGGMGEVFLAVIAGAQGIKKLVVVKRLRDTLAEDKNVKAMFIEEGRIASRLNHPNVVQTIEVGEEGDSLYLSMEFLEGQALSELARKLEMPLAPVMLARIVSDALAGVHYAHELRDYDGTPLGIVHRDLSPHNIFITYDGVVKVLDFGIAKASSHADSTEPGTLKGKVSYMAPEQLSADSVDRRADIFVAGIVLWELLTRRRLMAESSMAQTVHRLLHEPIERVSSIVPNVDSKLDEIVARALEKDPARRFETAQQMRSALEAYIESTGRAVRQEDVGRIVTERFAHRRERVRRKVQVFMNSGTVTASSKELPTLSTMRRGFDGSSGSVLPGVSASMPVVGRPEASFAPSRILTVGFVLAVGVGALFAGLRSRPRSSIAELPARPALVATSEREPAPAAATPTTLPASTSATQATALPTSTAQSAPRSVVPRPPNALAPAAVRTAEPVIETPPPAPSASSTKRKFRTEF